MTAVTTQFGQSQHTAHSSSSLRNQPRSSPSNRSSQSGTSPRAYKAPVLVQGSSGTMPSAARPSSGAGSLTLAAGRTELQTKSSAPRPQTENGLLRRNSTSNHKRPSSAPGDDNKPTNGTNGVDQRPAVGRPAKPPLMRSRSEHPSHPSRGLKVDTGAESSTDEQTIAAAEDFGTRHGFDGHYQSEDIISQLANVGAPFLPPVHGRSAAMLLLLSALVPRGRNDLRRHVNFARCRPPITPLEVFEKRGLCATQSRFVLGIFLPGRPYFCP